MKKTVKKIAAVGLTLTSVMSLVACGNTDKKGGNNGSSVDWANIDMPGHFEVMIDGTVVKKDNGRAEFEAYLKELTKLDFEFADVDHDQYYDQVASRFTSQDYPDVLILASDRMATYASQGLLWNMEEAWENSEIKASGRLYDNAESVMNSLRALGVDGEEGLYGFANARGNGCVTYIKKSWVEAAGLKVADIKDKQMTWAEFYDMCKKMKAANPSKYVAVYPEFISKEAPYTNYLPEYYQDAEYTFYKGADGKYVDGFSEKAMQDALQRIQTAVKDGIINPDTATATTGTSRDAFAKNNDTGVYTYWAGTWGQTLLTNAKNNAKNYANGVSDDEIFAIQPIKETGAYLDRITPAWCITYSAYEKGLAEGIYRYFLESMLDGGDVQTAWTYGAKGTHWDDVEETLTTADGKKTYSYKAGQFHTRLDGTGGAKVKKNNIDPNLSLGKFTNGDPGLQDPDIKTPVMEASNDVFTSNCKMAVAVPATETYTNNIGDINLVRNELISKVALGDMSVADAMTEYKTRCGSKVEAVLKDLNSL